jgi:tetratricopeptide (TPR) repeat protein
LSEQPEKQDHRARRALYAGIAFAFLFALTWSLSPAFGWVFFLFAAYSFFLYWFYTPRQVNPVEERPFEYKTSAERANEIVRKVTRMVWIGAGSIFLFFIVVNILSGKKDIATEEESVSAAFALEETSEWNAKGYEFYVNQRYDSALYYFDRVLRLESSNTTALYQKGLVYYDQQKMDKAMDSFTRAYDAGLRDAFLSHVLGYLNDNSGNTSRAIDFYKEALSLDSARADIYARLAELEPGNAGKYIALQTRWSN